MKGVRMNILCHESTLDHMIMSAYILSVTMIVVVLIGPGVTFDRYIGLRDTF